MNEQLKALLAKLPDDQRLEARMFWERIYEGAMVQAQNSEFATMAADEAFTQWSLRWCNIVIEEAR